MQPRVIRRPLTDFFRSDQQIVRAYSRWLHTSSQRDAPWLIRRGVLPVEPGDPASRH